MEKSTTFSRGATSDGGNSEEAETFYQTVGNMVRGGFVTLGMALGSRLGLFELMIGLGEPKTSLDIAEAGGFKERYVREWLGLMVTGGIVDIHGDEGDHYFIPHHRHHVLTDPSQLAVISRTLPIFAAVEQDIFKCFDTDGPAGVPYSRYPLYQSWLDQFTLNKANWDKLSSKLSLVPELLNKLESGAEVCDMGTSTGRIPIALARRFPRSNIWGLDCSEEAITKATNSSNEQKLTNVHFKVQDVSLMPADWLEKWDFVCMFDAAHDVPHSSRMMHEVLRTLKPGGYFLVDDIGLRSRHKDNIGNQLAPLVYGTSLFHCMPVSLNEPGGEGLGTAWGEELACQMLQDAGFVDVKLHKEVQPGDMVITCQKPIQENN